MPASVRTSRSARSSTDSNTLERWLSSRTDIPMPGNATRSRCISSSTGSGSTAGPAAKLKIRSVINAGWQNGFSYRVYEQSVPELRFEPGGLGRHDRSRIRNGHQLLHGHWIERKGDGGLTA